MDPCVVILIGFNDLPVCLGVSQTAAQPGPGCTKTICGGPFVSVDDEGVCAGYAHPYGGHAGCLDHDEGACVITAGEFWYKRTCTGDFLAA
jgi:hypothetical protein